MLKSIVLLILTANIWANPWPSGGHLDPQAGAPPTPRGLLHCGLSYSPLSNDYWKDSRMRMNLSMGLTNSIGLFISGSQRDVSGFGSFQRGTEDMKMGLGVWPVQLAQGRFRLGMNANLLLPTGFRGQQLYYDSLGNASLLPAFSLNQSAGEFFAGSSWKIGAAAELNAFGGLFSTSNRSDQAYRWGLNTWLAPFGPRIALETGFVQSFTRTGELPNTSQLTAALSMKLPMGMRLVPGFSADLTDDPLVGAGIELRLSKFLPSSVFPEIAKGPPEFECLSGVALIPPPQVGGACTDCNACWQSLRAQMTLSFEQVAALQSLDQPGLPFVESSSARFWQSVKAIGLANPEANWLIVTTIEQEGVAPAKGLDVPLLASRPQYQAQCNARVRVVNMLDLSLLVDEVISGKSKRALPVNVDFVNGSQEGMLTAANTRTLMFDAYRDLAEQISLRIAESEPFLPETPVAVQE